MSIESSNTKINQLADVFRRIQSGDDSAWNECYELTKSTVYYRLKVSNVPERDIEDAMQEIYVKIYENIGKQNDPATAAKWVGRIAANTAADYYRKAVVRHEVLVQSNDDEKEANDFFDREDDFMVPERVMEDDDVQREIREILQSLPKNQRDTLAEFYYNERSIAEIALLREVPEGSVKSDLSRGRKAFREKVQSLEKQYGKLFAIAPVVFFGFIFGEEAFATAVPTAVDVAVAKSVSSFSVNNAASHVSEMKTVQVQSFPEAVSDSTPLEQNAAASQNPAPVQNESIPQATSEQQGATNIQTGGVAGTKVMTGAAVGTAAGAAAAAGATAATGKSALIAALVIAGVIGGGAVTAFAVVPAVVNRSHSDMPAVASITEMEVEVPKEVEAVEQDEEPVVAELPNTEEEKMPEQPVAWKYNVELEEEPFTLTFQQFSDYTENEDCFTIRTDIGESLYLESGQYEKMNFGDEVNVLDTHLTKYEFEDDMGDMQECLKTDDGILLTSSEFYYGIPFYKDWPDEELGRFEKESKYIEGKDWLAFAGDDGWGELLYVENYFVDRIEDYELQIRKDALLHYVTWDENNDFSESTMNASDFFSNTSEPPFLNLYESAYGGDYKNSEYCWGFLHFDEDGLVRDIYLDVPSA